MKISRIKALIVMSHTRVKNNIGFAIPFYGIVSLVFGLLFLIYTPVFWGTDEPAHFARAYEISHGNLRTDKVTEDQVKESIGVKAKSFGGFIPRSTKESIDLAYADLISPPVHSGGFEQVKDKHRYSREIIKTQSTETSLFVYPGSAANSPIAYAPVIPGLILAEKLNLSIGHTIFLARASSLLATIALTVISIIVLKKSYAKWLIIVIALMPTVVFQSSIISTDGLTNAVVFIFSALIIKNIFLKKQLTSSELALLCGTLIAMPLLKSNLIFLIPVALATVYRGAAPARYWKWAILVSIIIGSSLFVIWLKFNPDITNTLGVLRGDKNFNDVVPKEQLKFIFNHPFVVAKTFVRTILLADNYYINSMVGVLGFSMVQVPFVAIFAVFVAMSTAVLGVDSINISLRKLLYIAGPIFIFVASVFATLYYTFTQYRFEVVEGIQGRYFIPIMPLVLVCIGACLNKIRVRGQQRNNTQLIMALASIVALVLSIVKYLYVIWG